MKKRLITVQRQQLKNYASIKLTIIKYMKLKKLDHNTMLSSVSIILPSH